MNDLGRFVVWDEAGIQGVQAFAHRAGCFITSEKFENWPDIMVVTIMAPPFVLENVADARSAQWLGLMPEIPGACYYERK